MTGVGPSLLFCLGATLSLACSSEPAASEKPRPKPDASLIDTDSGVDAALDSAGDAADGPDTPPFDGPPALSATGLFSDILTRTLSPGVRPYGVRYELWSDGAEKQRFLYLPPGKKIDTTSMDVWRFPIGTKAWKEFRKNGKLVETRLLWKKAEGAEGWLKVAYSWSADESDAFPAPAGMPDALGTTHDVPSVDACEQCHNGVGDVLIGVAAIQLSKESGGGHLSKLIAEDVLSNPPSGEFAVPGDGTIEDAIGYVHGNCGHCHNNEHFLAQKRSLRLKLLTSVSTPEESGLYKTAIGATTSHVLEGTTISVVPGNPGESQLLVRMKLRNLEGMPPVGTEQVDLNGTLTIENWISGLPAQ